MKTVTFAGSSAPSSPTEEQNRRLRLYDRIESSMPAAAVFGFGLMLSGPYFMADKPAYLKQVAEVQETRRQAGELEKRVGHSLPISAELDKQIMQMQDSNECAEAEVRYQHNKRKGLALFVFGGLLLTGGILSYTISEQKR